MKKSLTRQIMTIIVVLIASVIVICLLINTLFLGVFYTDQKKDLLVQSFSTIETASEAETLYTSDFDKTFDNLCSNGNISIIIMSADGTALRSSVNDVNIIQRQLMDIMFNRDKNGKGTEIVDSTDNYVLEQMYDTRMGNADYLVLWGTLADGNVILMRTAMESIRESTGIANRFLLFVGLAAIGGSIIISFFASRRITKPILELSEISKKMVDLDFNAKYQADKFKEKPGKIRTMIAGVVHHPSSDAIQEAVVSESRNQKTLLQGNEIDQLGAHMNQLSENLERTISELKSANNELMMDIEKKEEIDEMRKEFLSNVSHELKTPLALIQGYAEGLQECINDDAESRDFYCDVIIDEADKMNKMVKKLLTLNQLEFGNDQVVMERFNITELISGVINSTTILREQNGITLECDLIDQDVWADEFKVEEVITNYMSNAIHHASGEKKIRIFYEKKEKTIRISVFNTGTPIPQEDIENIWIKFYKVDKARTREYGGSGIGLSIVKAIMESFHQECGVINHEDGVEFWFELETQ